MFLEDCEILENICISDNNFLMRVLSTKAIKHSKAGQFFMLKSNTYLRRPISLYYMTDNTLEFYYHIKGSGTKYISNLKSGDIINIQGPLGNGFDTNIENNNILLIAGGVGIAPMKLLIDKLLEKNNKITFIAGGSNSGSVSILNFFNFDSINTFICTDDGSVGEKLNTVQKFRSILDYNKFDRVYTCGPTIMMNLVSKIAIENNIECYASLENMMACGVNVCLGCSIKTNIGQKKVCYDGSVFNSKDLILE